MQSFHNPLGSPTQETRIFGPLPAQILTDPVKCTLRTVSLTASQNTLQSLNVWSDPSDKLSIRVDGTFFSGNTQTVRYHKFVLISGQSPLWVDEISIDQADIVENSVQILLMEGMY